MEWIRTTAIILGAIWAIELVAIGFACLRSRPSALVRSPE
jgi:hypothetical protein